MKNEHEMQKKVPIAKINLTCLTQIRVQIPHS